MISIKELNEAIKAYKENDNVNYNDLVDECENFLDFLEVPYNSFSIVTVLEMAKFFLDDDSVKNLNDKLAQTKI
jgi:hypothetical protein